MFKIQFLPVMIALVPLGISSTYAERVMTEAGPENGGLRLRLIIEQAADAKNDERKIRLELMNVSDKEVELVAHEFYEEDGDYADFFRSDVVFDTFPPVMQDSAQTTGFERKSPQPRLTLKPDESLTDEWKESGRRLKMPDGMLDAHYNKAPTFPSVGLYGVKARITVVTAKGKRLLLVSNEQQLSVRGSKSMPKYAVARIVSTNEEMESLSIDLGSDKGIEPGDKFTTTYNLGTSWRITIRNVSSIHAEGTVEPIHRADRPDVPTFPVKGAMATLIPE